MLTKEYAQRSIIDLSIVLFSIQPVSKHKPQKNWKQRSSCCNSRGTTSCSSPSTTHFFNSATVTRPSPSVSTTRKAKSASCGVSSGAPVCQRGEDMMDMIIDYLIWLISFISLHWFHCLWSSQATTWKDLQNLHILRSSIQAIGALNSG